MKSVLILFDNIISLYIWILIINAIISWLVALIFLTQATDLFIQFLKFLINLRVQH